MPENKLHPLIQSGQDEISTLNDIDPPAKDRLPDSRQEPDSEGANLVRFAAVFETGEASESVLAAVLSGGVFQPVMYGAGTRAGDITPALMVAWCGRVWPRVRQRWSMIETGLAQVAAGAFGRQALRYQVALEDAWQRFDGEPEERDALFDFYCCFVVHLDWPVGFSRQELLETFMLD
ncbi:hypothetical protein [Methylorubrum populi]